MEQNLTDAARQDEQILQILPKAKESAKTEEKILSHAFLTIEEVAMLLRVSKRTVYNLIYKGVLRATKVTYHVTIISKQDFLNMLERNSYVKTVALSKAEKQSDSLAPHNGKQKSKSDAEQEIGSDGIVKEKKDVAPSAKAKKPRKVQSHSLIPSSSYRQSVRDTFTDREYKEDELYTMTEICRKYDCRYG